ncbi:hypothetical protein CSUI_010323 [Cystoisospora suis]|uniref:Uncharacterized protein n=1 Tax=Cystoisospora suis TaxID=483139 RepID=A0A2C6KHR1_9APIC|nr:hypothetical protein CSUI_010323 [Cystoisospora suis]
MRSGPSSSSVRHSSSSVQFFSFYRFPRSHSFALLTSTGDLFYRSFAICAIFLLRSLLSHACHHFQPLRCASRRSRFCRLLRYQSRFSTPKEPRPNTCSVVEF